MKTNHRRNFKDTPQRFKGGSGSSRKSALADCSIGATVPFDFSNGHRGMARAVRGAKKFVNSRIRFRENAATKKLAYLTDADMQAD